MFIGFMTGRTFFKCVVYSFILHHLSHFFVCLLKFHLKDEVKFCFTRNKFAGSNITAVNQARFPRSLIFIFLSLRKVFSIAYGRFKQNNKFPDWIDWIWFRIPQQTLFIQNLVVSLHFVVISLGNEYFFLQIKALERSHAWCTWSSGCGTHMPWSSGSAIGVSRSLFSMGQTFCCPPRRSSSPTRTQKVWCVVYRHKAPDTGKEKGNGFKSDLKNLRDSRFLILHRFSTFLSNIFPM